ncbi:MAG: hypothetical protein LIP77_04325, partial [Planctomycetes bacterium]|nr:hypothetical protein [Planctomycetota bacterium]
MQITPGTFVYYRTATPTTGAGPGLQPSEETTDRWSTGDRVEVGATGHQERFGVLGGEPDPEALAERRQRIGYSKEDLASLKARFAAYTERSHELTAAVEKAAAAVGVRPGHAVQIKVEVGSDGTVRVGGIDDAGKTRALERAIARDGDLFRGLRDFQELEQDLSTDLRAVTGMSLTDYRSRIASLQTGGGMDSLTGDGNTYDREQCLKLMDQDLYVVDNEFGQMISEHFRTARSGTVGVDISGDNNILEDAGGTVRDAFAAIMRDVSDYIRDVNDDLRKHYPDPEELKEKLVSLTNVSI